MGGFPRRGIIILLGLVALWFGADYVYSKVVLNHMATWENSIKRDADGVRVGCREYTKGEGETALLLIHGFSDSPALFSKMAPALAEKGFTCRVMRLPGFGKTVKEYGLTSRTRCQRAIKEELVALRKDHSFVAVVAHSLGGALAIDLLLDQPELADAVIPIAPQIAVSDERSPVLSAQTWHTVAGNVVLITDVVENSFAVDGHSAEAAAYDLNTPFVPRSVYDMVFKLTDRLAARKKELAVPVLMVLSREDKVTDYQAAEALYEASTAELKEIHFVEDAGHLIPLDNGWEGVVDRIAVFVGKVDPESAVAVTPPEEEPALPEGETTLKTKAPSTEDEKPKPGEKKLTPREKLLKKFSIPDEE
jgi:carboxylesterase